MAFKPELSVLLLRIYFYFSSTCMHVTVGDYVCVSVEDRLGGPGTGVSSSPEPVNMGAGNLTNFSPRVENALERYF